MKPNTTKLLGLNTGHLSPSTLEKMSNKEFQEDLLIHPLAAGFFLTTASFMLQEIRKLPEDLHHILRYAFANDITSVMVAEGFERQAGLPFYGSQSSPDLTGCNISPDQLISSGDTMFVSPDLVSMGDLAIEQTWTETLPDADFEAPDGAWIGIRNASIRILPMDNMLQIVVLPRGHEMDDPLRSISIAFDEIEPEQEEVRPL